MFWMMVNILCQNIILCIKCNQERKVFYAQMGASYHEPLHDKTNKMSVRPAKTQISLGIRIVAVHMKKAWVLSYPLSASKYSDQTGQMPRLIWDFVGAHAIFPKWAKVMRRLI